MELIIHEYYEYLPLMSGCGKPAFYSLKMINNIPSSHADDLLTLDGEKPELGKPMFCGSCGKPWAKVEMYGIKVHD